MQEKIRYGGREYGVGDEFDIYFHFLPIRGTYIARSDEGIVIFPEIGSRMVPEMISERWKIVHARVKLLKIHQKRDKKFVVIVRPIEWSGVYK